ncbi:PREDICTED: major centromere autoantigen B-like [Fragaria vesca subsp. vesca]|uniref:major centromere autoantigen B-like n=1 Tax=Fragaria vesca subsp. vesca TaxID=101020 RepID=UPI0002C33129|nr:PREDICTED: major centromere autoantigen B-like [Fragaria vesca subsp. vesca]
MDVSGDQPTIGGPAGAEAGCGSRKRLDGSYDLEQVLYDASKKAKISEQELQEIHAKMNKGADPNKKLSEQQAGALRRIIDGWKVRGEVLILPFEEFQETMFMNEAECQKLYEELEEAEAAKQQAKALRKLKIAEKKQTGKPDEEDSDEELRHCEVCMKLVDHWSYQCPYLDDVPNPENTTVGEGYEIRCLHCNKSDHGHPDGGWPGYACKKRRYYRTRVMTPDEEVSDSESDEEDKDSESDEEDSDEESGEEP